MCNMVKKFALITRHHTELFYVHACALVFQTIHGGIIREVLCRDNHDH